MNELEKAVLHDTTDRILYELENMIKDGLYKSRPKLEQEIKELIQKVNTNEVNLFDYRRSNSIEKYGAEIIESISIAHQRQSKNR